MRMNSLRNFILSLLFAFSATILTAQMSGNYTINGSGTATAINYLTFGSAISDMTNGSRADGGPPSGPNISAAVTFTIAAGTYNERVVIGPITGMSTTNTITFDGVDPATRKITWAGAATNDYTFHIGGTDYMTLKNLTIENTGTSYGYGLQITNQANWVTIENNIIKLPTTATNSYQVGLMVGTYYTQLADNANYLNFKGNQVIGGRFGIVLNGAPTAYSQVNTIEDNTITDAYYYGIYSQYQELVKYKGNTVQMRTGSTTNYGMYLRYVSQFELSHNKINKTGTYAVYLYYANTLSTNRSKIYNNFIGGDYQTTSTGYGFYCFNLRYTDMWHNTVNVDANLGSRCLYLTGSSNNNDIRNNCFAYTGPGSSGYVIYITSTSYVTSLDYNNYYSNGNSFAYFQGNYADLSALQAGQPGFNSNSKEGYPNFNTSTDLHVYGAQLANWAVNLPGMTSDIDGDPRPFPPDVTRDVGADEYVLPAYDIDIFQLLSPTVLTVGNNTVALSFENRGNNSLNGINIPLQYSVNGGTTWGVTETFTPTSMSLTGNKETFSFTTPWNVTSTGNYTLCVRIDPSNPVPGDPDTLDQICVNVCTGMSGTFTINGGSPTGGTNFNTFADAITALTLCGITGAVNINVAPGTYNEFLTVTTIPGASSTNTVTFDGDQRDSVHVEYSHSLTNTWIVKLDNADYVNFKNMTFTSLGNYGYVFYYTNAADYNTIDNCGLYASTTINSAYSIGIVIAGLNYATAGNNANFLTVKNSTISGGYYGIRSNGPSTTTYQDGNRFLDNEIIDFYYYGAYFRYDKNLEVSGNTMIERNPGGIGGYGIYGYYIDENFKFDNNTIHSVGARALYCSYCNYSGTGTGSVSNNMFGDNFQTSGTVYAVYMYNTKNTNIYHNSINLGWYTGYAFYLAGSSSGNNVKNNIFASVGGGFAGGAAIWLSTQNVVASIDYNAYWTDGPTLVRVGSVNYADMNAYNLAYPLLEQNSIEERPGFVTNTDLHIFCSNVDNMGTPIAGFTMDIDGDTRSLTTPDIGADEFNGVTVSIDVGPDTAICGGLTLVADTNVWKSSLWNGKVNSFDLNVDTTGEYYVLVLDSNGCYATDTTDVIVWNQPTAPWKNDTVTVCWGQILDAGNPGSTYLWSPGSDTTQTIWPGNPATYTVQITSADGCVQMDTRTVSFYPIPSIDLGPDTTFCLGGSALLDAGNSVSGQSVVWSTGASSQVVLVSAPGTYTATVTTPSGCVVQDQVVLNALLPPVVNLGGDRHECGPFVLDAGNPGDSYQWSNSSSNQTLNANSAGTYSVTVTNAAGCSYADTVSILMGSNPIVNLGVDKVLCVGQALTLDAGNPGFNYFWSTGASSQTITATIGGLYIAQVEHPVSGCKGYDTVLVTISNLTVNLGPDPVLCPGSTLLLNAGNPGNTYAWSGGGNTQTLSITSPGTYSVTVTDALNCNATDQVVVTSGPGITSNYSGPGSIPLYLPAQFTDNSSSGAVSWYWDFGDGSTSTAQNPSHVFVAMGSFNVCLTVSNGTCSHTFCNNITIDAPIGVEDESLAAGINLYPNPNSGLFNVGLDFAESMNLGIAIYDISGKVIYSKQIGTVSKHTEKVDISSQQSGIYFVKIFTDDGRENVKKILLD